MYRTFVPMDYSEIYNRVSNFDTTAEWRNFYLEEAESLKAGEFSYPSLSYAQMQKQRFAYLSKFANDAVRARSSQIEDSVAALAGRMVTAGAGLVPFGKAVAKPLVITAFNAEAMNRLGMADRDEVNALHREACSKAKLITSIPEFWTHVAEDLKSKGKKEIFKEIWEDPDFQKGLQEEIAAEFGEEMATQLTEEAVHIKPVLGQAYSSMRGWQSSGSAMNKALAYLTDVALEFHQKVLLVVVVATVLYASVSPLDMSQR
jgi:hypothetical protein